MLRQLHGKINELLQKQEVSKLEMESRIAELQAKVESQRAEQLQTSQQLFSKMSALSTQQAPGLFAGANKRKHEREQEVLRQSGLKLKVSPAMAPQMSFFGTYA